MVSDSKMPTRHDDVIARVRETVQQVRGHQHPAREGFYCMNLVGWMGELQGTVLEHIDALEESLAKQVAYTVELRRVLGAARHATDDPGGLVAALAAYDAKYGGHEHDWQPLGFVAVPGENSITPADHCLCGAKRYAESSGHFGEAWPS